MVKKCWVLSLLAVAVLSGCAISSLSARHDVAVGIARPAGMTEQVIKAGTFNLTTWEKISQPEAPVNVYIEGDGLAWLNKHTKSLNPTPINPLSLRLAALDKSANVIYMARPCQYTGWNNSGACPDLYWTNGRTAAEVISSYTLALDDIKLRHHVAAFNLIGYSGGAAVAALVAADRSDVLSLKTVAGNMDYTVFSTIHAISPMNASLNPIETAARLAAIPQLHFIGGSDTIIPPAIFNSWLQASGTAACLQSVTVTENTHEKGWVEKWPELLNTPAPACASISAATADVAAPAAATPAAAAPAAATPAAATPAAAAPAAAAPAAAPSPAPKPSSAPEKEAPPLGTL